MKVIVGLSGGVDSAVAAYVLSEQGYQVSAIFMKNWDDDDGTEHCTAQEDFLSACKVADHLGITLDVVNFSKEYKEEVFSLFLNDIQRGLTPNPDILCNSKIKFNAFANHALAQGADMIATGHYARIERGASGDYQLLCGTDPHKDQSYFLYRLNQTQLSRALFPLGAMHKIEVRRLARKYGLPNADRKDSTGICFIGERNFSEFLGRYISPQQGDIVTLDGAVIGQHSGVHLYTIGQRKGLKIGGVAHAEDAPWYVADKEVTANRLIVVQGEHPMLFRNNFEIDGVHWISDAPTVLPLSCEVKIRHQQKLKECTISRKIGSRYLLNCSTQRAVTLGQSAVLYENDRCLGGGDIA